MAKAQTPKGDGWHKCPSVWTGGAAYFWARRNPHNGKREWYKRDDNGDWGYWTEGELPAGQTWGYLPLIRVEV